MKITSDSIEMTAPDDWHLHLRDQTALPFTVPATARCFERAIIMPNLVPPITKVSMAAKYRQEILRHVPKENTFQPLMTLYLTPETTPKDIQDAKQGDVVYACKLYPAGATTNSARGIRDFSALDPVFREMERLDLPLLVHGEVTEEHIDIFDREKVFIERHLSEIRETYPELRIVMEHITTSHAVEFVKSAGEKTAATITPQHLLYNRNDMLVGGIRPHLYCLPILKAFKHQQALQEIAISGNSRFFLGTDSAPHSQKNKESGCGCAGCFSAPVAMELYVSAFEQLNALEKLESFCSYFGPAFYKLPPNTTKIHLKRVSGIIPETLNYINDEKIVPLGAGGKLNWKVT